MAEAPVYIQHHARRSTGQMAVWVVAIGFLVIVALLNLVMPAFDQQGSNWLGRLWPLFLTGVFGGMAGFQAWQLRAALEAERRHKVLYRFDGQGAHVFPVIGRPRMIEWDKLQRISKRNNALFLIGRSPGGQRSAFIASLKRTGEEEALTVIRHYRPDLLPEVPRQ